MAICLHKVSSVAHNMPKGPGTARGRVSRAAARRSGRKATRPPGRPRRRQDARQAARQASHQATRPPARQATRTRARPQATPRRRRGSAARRDFAHFADGVDVWATRRLLAKDVLAPDAAGALRTVLCGNVVTETVAAKWSGIPPFGALGPGFCAEFRTGVLRRILMWRSPGGPSPSNSVFVDLFWTPTWAKWNPQIGL